MISNIFNYKKANINKNYGLLSTKNNTNISNIINIAKSSYKNNTYTLYDNNNALFISNYTSSLTNLKELNLKLINNNRNSVLNNLSASSSNENILNVQSFFTIKDKASYKVKVKQIAKSQVNSSTKLESDEISTLDIATINISTKSKDYSFTIDTNGKTNKEFLLDFASKINKSNIGISAIVKEDKSYSTLELIGDKSGENETFSVSASEEFMSKTGLSNTTQIAQDAVYDVIKNGTEMVTNKTSSINDVDIDGYNVSALLKSTGEVNIDINIDKKKLSNAINNFVSAYNSTINFLGENKEKGSGVSRQLDKLKISSFYEKNLKSLGILRNSDGYLKIDNNALNNALNNNISEIEKELKSRYSIFSTIDKSINNALKESTISLIDGRLYYGQDYENTNYVTDSNSFYKNIYLLSMYNQSGTFGLINYGSMGLFLNMCT